MSDRAAFLAAIAATPADDLPRLVFADWLDEHGDPHRAEFIRLQCGEAGGDPTGSTRADELQRRYRSDWLGPLARLVFHAEFRRGFAEHAVLSATAFLEHGRELRGTTPLCGVTLLGARQVLPDLIRSPLLSGLSALHLTGGRLGDDGVRLLAASPALGGLQTLRLGDNAVTDAGVLALARSPHLAALTTLVLRDNAIGDGGAWDLAHAPSFDRLTTLDLAGNEIGPSGQDLLRSARRLPLLTNLDVSDQRLPAGRQVRALAMAK